MAESIIIPLNKSKEICSKTLTNSMHSIRIGVEQSAAAFTFYSTSMSSGAVVILKAYHVGNDTDDEVLLFESGSLRKIGDTPYTFEIECPGPIRLDIIVSGTVTYTCRAKGIDAVVTTNSIVTLSNAAELKGQLSHMTQLLEKNNNLLGKLVNHMRVITDIDDDKGDLF